MSNGSAGNYEDHNAGWCVANDSVTLDVHINCDDREIYTDNLNGPMLKHFTDARDHECHNRRIHESLLQGRQARFEHGEKPEVG
jgi:hypothetical protein